MIIPWNTDAPIYHFPLATIGLILVNTFVFVLTGDLDEEQAKQWCLVFGQGLHPVQWFTSNFMHEGILPLVGNMIFLWSFGLVIEGKLGWTRFLPLYLAMAIVYGLLAQLIMLHSEGTERGASGVVYAMLAIAMVWAPNSELSCFQLITFKPLQLSIYVFALLYPLLQLFAAFFDFFNEFAVSSEILHMTGLIIGGVVGVVMLKTRLVDCDGCDLFSVVAGREGEAPVERPERVERPAPIEREFQIAEAERQIQAALQAGHPAVAFKLAQKSRTQIADWELSERQLLTIIRSLQQGKQWQASIAPMVEYLKLFPEKSTGMRIQLAQILLLDQHRPYRALSVLAKLPADSLTPEQTALRAKLTATAQSQLEDADLEVADEDW